MCLTIKSLNDLVLVFGFELMMNLLCILRCFDLLFLFILLLLLFVFFVILFVLIFAIFVLALFAFLVLLLLFLGVLFLLGFGILQNVPFDDGPSGVLQNLFPVLEAWLVGLGLIPT